MSLGSIFVGLAIVVIVIAYIARPFRAASSAASGTDKLIEAWVRAAPVAAPGAEDIGTVLDADVATSVSVTPAPVVVPQAAAQPVTPQPAAPLAGDVNFCPQCGRRVTAEYRFCPGCGALLPHEEGAPFDGAPSYGAPSGGVV